MQQHHIHKEMYKISRNIKILTHRTDQNDKKEDNIVKITE